MASIVQTINLTKIYRRAFQPPVMALDGLSLEIKPGEIFGILGPNGSGKTTLLKLLLGLIFPTRGQAFLFGCPARNERNRQRLGYLPEQPYFYEYLTPVEILDFYGRIFGLEPKVRKERIGELLDLVGLSQVRFTPLRTFSKGMLQRAGLASSLINDPELLLLDEPTLGLDPVGAREMKDLFARLKERGKTIILSSHLLADVERVCDRVGILYQGKLIDLGALDELLSVQDETRIIASRLSEEAKRKIERAIAEDRAQLIAIDHPRESLEEYFVRAVKEKTD